MHSMHRAAAFVSLTTALVSQTASPASRVATTSTCSTRRALSAAAQVDPNGPDLFTAMREQLGLKLESKKMPLEGMVVDEIQPPTED